METSVHNVKMKNFLTFVLIFSCLCSFAKADNLDPLSRMYLSDKKYAKNIEVKAYLVTKDQVAKLFCEENGEVSQKTNKELHGHEVFLLIRCKNFGDYRAFGTLKCKRTKRGGLTSIEIMMMPGYMKSFHDSVFPGYSGNIPNDDNIPVITCEWKNLYTI